MEYQSLTFPSKVDREYRELEKRVREELFTNFRITMMEFLRVMLEDADERAREAERPSAGEGTVWWPDAVAGEVAWLYLLAKAEIAWWDRWWRKAAETRQASAHVRLCGDNGEE
jgi:hypothetical protein